MRKADVLRAIGLAIMLGGSALAVACEREGPVEEAIEELQDEAEDAAEEVEDAVD